MFLSSTCLMPFKVFAVDQTINLNNTNYVGPIFAAETLPSNNYDNVTINVNNSTFSDKLSGNRKKTIVNQTLNFNSGTVNTFLAGHTRANSGGNVSGINTVNISGGTILAHVAATVDDGTYTGTARRRQNVINFSGGNIQGPLVGGASADENIITVTGGTLGKVIGGTFVASNIMAGAGGLFNPSTNTWVHLKDMNNSNSFLSSFVDNAGGTEGTILGGVIPGTSNMNFDNINGNFRGGFKNFNNMFLDSASNVIFSGTSYFADNWNISGTLDTNGKTLHAYKNDTIQLAINSTGKTINTFISNANVNAQNAGFMNGIQTTKNITANNTGIMSGNYTGNTVNIINNGKINDATHTNTTVASTNAGSLTNHGQIGGDAGSVLTVNGNMTISNETDGSIEGKVVLNDAVSSFANKGLMGASGAGDGSFELVNNSTTLNEIDNTGAIKGTGSITSVNLLNLNNNSGGLISGTQTLKNVNLNNASGAFVENANLISDTLPVAISNEGTFSGSNSLAGTNGGTFTFDNKTDGLITGALDVKSGLDSINNEGTINNLALQSERDNLTIDNKGSFTGDNVFTSDKKITLNNTGVSSGTVTVNAAEVDVIQSSTTELTNDFYGNLPSALLSFDNKAGSTIKSGLFNQFDTINVTNEDLGLTAPEVSLTNNGLIASGFNLKNKGYMKLTNTGSITGMINDIYFDVTQDCLKTIFEIDNTNSITSSISVLNNKFILTNSGLITSEHIDSKHLTLDNTGTFNSNGNYLFGVQDYVNANNSGYIYSKDKAFMFTGDKTSGTITNSGTIWSEGTTIGFADTLTPCPNGCGYTGKIDLYNTGKIVSVDPNNLTMPSLDSYAIKADNMNVFNQSGGLIGGSILANNYTQNNGATWVTFLDKDKEEMSTITVKDKVSIDKGSTLFIYTNNDVQKFKDDDAFLVVQTDPDTSTMTDDEIYAQLNNYTLKSDSPFANYQMLGYDRNGYIVFNSVGANTYAGAADTANSNHSNIAMTSHRFYELFVNKNVEQISNLASGDNPNSENGLYFMPIAGYAKQDGNGGHSGYDTNYYGGVGYFEHVVNQNVTAGLGLAYLYSDSDHSDTYKSTSDMDTYRPFAYVDYENGDFRADLAVGYARHNIDNNRKYSFNDRIYDSKSNYSADEYSGHLNLGYKLWNQNGEIIQPIVGLYGAHIKADGYKEKGNGPMNMYVNAEDYNSIKSMLGVKMSKEYTLENSTTIIPEVHLRWYHEMADTQGGVGAYFLAQEELFNAKGVKTPKDIGDIAFRLTTKSGKDFDLFTEAYYQFGKSFYNVGGTIGVQYNF